jgi:hypothetical protein
MNDSVPIDDTSPTPASSQKRKRRQPPGFEQQTGLIRNLIWLYIVLWLIEGGLRRWVLPGLATPLLIVRDPLVVVIYAIAVSKGLFPTNGFIFAGAILAFLSFVSAMAVGHQNLVVALYGVRCDFFHVPLIFIMARVLQQKDLMALAKVAVWLAIPYTALLATQFYAPQDAWVNRGIGGSLEGAGYSGALDRFRPPGTFSFITGPAELYPLFTACWFALVLARKLPGWLMVASGIAILTAIPVSISRLLFLSVALVAITGIVALFVGGRFSASVIFRVALAAILLPILATQLPAFKDGMEAFGARWETSTTDQGGFHEAIVDRTFNTLFKGFDGVRAEGLGTGFSTIVGQKLMTTQVGQNLLTTEVGFGGSEAEWGRLLFDNGYILGSLEVGYRIALASYIVLVSFRAWQRRAPEGLIFASTAFVLLLYGQWGQASALGAAVIAGGLTLVAATHLGAANLQVERNKVKTTHGNKQRPLIPQ